MWKVFKLKSEFLLISVFLTRSFFPSVPAALHQFPQWKQDRDHASSAMEQTGTGGQHQTQRQQAVERDIWCRSGTDVVV